MKIALKLTAVMIFIAFFSLNVLGQQYNFQNYSVREGLSQSQSVSICQDKNGFLWIATNGGGLNKFDGEQFVQFTDANGLSHNSLWKVISDHFGNIWIGTENGISKYDGKTFTVYNENVGLPKGDVWEIYEDNSGNIWFGYENGGAVRYNGHDFKRFSTKEGLPFDDVNTIFKDTEGNMWFGSYGNGICKYDGDKYVQYDELKGFSGKYITDILQFNENEIWFSSERGIWVYKNKSFQIVDDTLFSKLSIEKMLIDRMGNIWIGTYDEGVYRKNFHGDILHFTKNNGLSSNYIFDLFQDSYGNVWIATDGGGICMFKGKKFVQYTEKEGLASNVVMSILRDSFGNMWFATENGVTELLDDSIITYNVANGLSTKNTYTLFEDLDKNIWISTDNGVCKIHNGIITTYGASKGFTNSPSTNCYEDKFGTLWIGAQNGVYKYIYKDDVFKKYNPNNLLSNGVNKILLDSKGKTWYATTDGLVMITFDKAVKFNEGNGIKGKEVLDLWEDPVGKLWFFTDRSLNIMSKGHFYTFGTKDGLASDNIVSMIFDGKDLWLGSEKGLDRITFSYDFESDSIIRHYGYEQGFTGIECNSWATYLDTNKVLWFGTINGATKFNPYYDVEDTIPPKVSILGLKVHYEKMNWKNICPECELQQNGLPINLVLPHNMNYLTFTIGGINFSGTNDIVYRCCLVGFDKGWLPPSKRNEITYTNLGPGEYTFMVQAMTSNKIWSTVQSYSFEIESSIWNRPWFMVLLILCGAGLVYSISVFRLRSIAASKRKLEELVRLRTADLFEQKKEVEKLSFVASQTEDGIIIADVNGNIEWINQSIRRLSGCSLERFKKNFGSTVEELSEYKDIKDFLKNIKTRKESIYYDVKIPSVVDGEDEKWLSACIIPTYNNNHQLTNIILIYTDISERKKYETKLQNANKNITDSIHYARQIQSAIMPHRDILTSVFPQSFIILKPKDIVSGDFYWFSQIGNIFVYCAVDCTGHGVPGAFMSMIGNEFLHQIVNNSNIIGPEQALKALDQKIKRTLQKSGKEFDAKDGMDMSLCVIHLDTLFAQYAGAFNPLLCVRNGELTVYEANKYSVGNIPDDVKDFAGYDFQLQKGDILYMYTDGFADQFGGPKGKKYFSRRLKRYLLSISNLPMDEQKQKLEQEFEQWKGENSQVDDLLIIGVKIDKLNQTLFKPKTRIVE